METDADLVAAVRRGDQGAFADFFDRFAPSCLRYAWGVLDSRDDVDDTVQEVFLVAWRRRTDLPGAVLPWLLVVTRNTAYNANRRRRRAQADELTDTASPAPEHADELRWVRAQVAALPEVEQQLVRMCLVEGIRYEVAAQQLGLSTAAARKRVQRVREKLRAAKDEG